VKSQQTLASQNKPAGCPSPPRNTCPGDFPSTHDWPWTLATRGLILPYAGGWRAEPALSVAQLGRQAGFTGKQRIQGKAREKLARGSFWQENLSSANLDDFGSCCEDVLCILSHLSAWHGAALANSLAVDSTYLCKAHPRKTQKGFWSWSNSANFRS